eukprot:g18620.t1
MQKQVQDKLNFSELESFNRRQLKPTTTIVRRLPVVDVPIATQKENQAEYDALKTRYLADLSEPIKEVPSDGKLHLEERMTGVDWQAMHGSRGDRNWQAPFIAVKCSKEARPGYASMRADEYVEDPAVLKEKVKLLAELLRSAKAVVAYTGAGISTASGISDYATKAKNTLVHKTPKKKGSGLEASSTLSHYVLADMHKHGLLHHWVQQNHDGLPQKAGFPPECLNEIHGAWFDPSNPVVPMTGTLREDLCHWMYEWERKADLTLAMGTSLCGMNADRMVTSVAKRANERRTCARQRALGAVIIGLQRTQHDHSAALRIFGKIDDVMALLATELGLPVPDQDIGYVPTVAPGCLVKPDVFLVPYSNQGKLLKTSGKEEKVAADEDNKQMHTTWDLTKGAQVKVTQGPGKGFTGVCLGKNADGHYRIQLPHIREGDITHGKGQVVLLVGTNSNVWQGGHASHCKRKLDPNILQLSLILVFATEL